MLKIMDFYHLQENLEINMAKKLMDTPTKTGIDAAKAAFKRLFQKTEETAGYLIGNEIADKITSVGKTKSKEREDERQ